MRSHCIRPPILARVHLHHPRRDTPTSLANKCRRRARPFPASPTLPSAIPYPLSDPNPRSGLILRKKTSERERHESKRHDTNESVDAGAHVGATKYLAPSTNERMRRDREKPGIAEGTSSASVPRCREEAGGTHERRGHANGERVWTARCSRHRRGVLGLQLRGKVWVSKQTSNDEEREAGRNEHKDWNGRSSNGKGENILYQSTNSTTLSRTCGDIHGSSTTSPCSISFFDDCS